jgi:hypothetical protein
METLDRMYLQKKVAYPTYKHSAELLGLVAWWSAGIAFCWLTRAPWIAANILVLGTPLIYLVARSDEVRKRLRISFILKYVVFVSVFFDYLCVRYGGWSGPTQFPLLPGGVNVEQVTWTALIIPLVLAVNETYFSRLHHVPQRRYPRTILSIMFFAGFAVAIVPPAHAAMESYVYLKIGLSLYPIVFILAFCVDRSVWREVLPIAIVFGIYNLIFELLALHLGYWSFHGKYVGYVSVEGYRFPTEELVFLVMLCAPAVVATYSLYKNWKDMGDVQT